MRSRGFMLTFRRMLVPTAIFSTLFFVSIAPAVIGEGVSAQASTQGDPSGIDPRLAAQLASAPPDDRLVVLIHAQSSDQARAAVASTEMVLVEAWDRVAVAVAAGTPTQIQRAAAQPGVTYLEADAPITFSLDTSHRATRGDDAQTLFQTVPKLGTGHRPGEGAGSGKSKPGQGQGAGWGHVGQFEPAFVDPIDGRGVTVAVLDSGVDGTHPFFQRPDGTSKVVRNLKLSCSDRTGMVTGTTCAESGGAAVWAQAPGNDSDTASTGGHGTHVAGIVAGVDTALPDGTKLQGAAPGADLVALSVSQVLTVYGGGSGLYWVLEHHADPCGNASCPPIRVVNNSWGVTGDYNANSAIAKIQDQLVDAGVVVVWANGNAGGDGSVNQSNAFAQAPKGGVLGVANYDDGNLGSRNRDLDGSSSRGHEGDLATYPDLSAPGTTILSSCRPTLPVCAASAAFGGRDGEGDWVEMSGTSMAAPHVAGVVAQLLQVKPAAATAEIEDALEDTAYKFGSSDRYELDLADHNGDDGTSFDAGHGLVDAVGAIARLLGLDPATMPPPAAECAPGSSEVASDPGGDATTTFGLPNPEGNIRALDVLAGIVLDDAASRMLTFTIEVDDLQQAPPAGTTGERVDVDFSYAGMRYFVSATNDRTSLRGPRFRLARFTGSAWQTLRDDLSGNVDYTMDTFTIILPYDAISPVVQDGSVLSALSITSWKVGLSLSPVDWAAGACPYVVGAGVVNPSPAPEPSPTPPPPEPTPHATLSEGQTFERDGTSPTDNVNHECTGPADPSCITYVLKLEPVDGKGTLDFTLTFGNPLDDFDVFIARWPTNDIVAAAATWPGTTEKGTAQLEAGTYYVIIQPYLASKSSAFHLEVSLSR